MLPMTQLILDLKEFEDIDSKDPLITFINWDFYD